MRTLEAGGELPVFTAGALSHHVEPNSGPAERGRYEPGRPARWTVLPIVVLLHAGVLLALLTLGSFSGERIPNAPLVVKVLSLDPPQPPAPRKRTAKPPKLELLKPITPKLVVPVPMIAVVKAQPSLPTTPSLPPPHNAVAPDPGPPAPSNDPVPSSDLSLKLLFADPPSYPLSARRNREQGVVVLEVVIGTGGAVEDIRVSRSSGFEALDRAALSKVRRWRWSPTVVDGRTVRVRGLVRIPFELKT